jgi:hypothetical protein
MISRVYHHEILGQQKIHTFTNYNLLHCQTWRKFTARLKTLRRAMDRGKKQLSQANLGELFFTCLTFFPFKHWKEASVPMLCKRLGAYFIDESAEQL